MIRIKVLILFLVLGIGIPYAQDTKQSELPNFVNAYVIKALNRNLDDVAKLNCLHQYYVNIYKENTTYNILPKLVERIKKIEDEILGTGFERKTHIDFTTYSTYNMFLIEKFDNSSKNYPKTLSEIETEIHIWLEQQKNEINWKQTLTLTKNLDYPVNDPNIDYSKILEEKKLINLLFVSISIANRNPKNTLYALFNALRRISNRYNIPIENYMQFVFVDNYDNLIGENRDHKKIRKQNTFLKFALDSKNYSFLREAIFIKDLNNKNICNPYIDFFRIEIIEGKQESLLDFFDMVIDFSKRNGGFDLHAVKNRRRGIMRCRKDQLLYEAHEVKNISEDTLKQIRLKYSMFYKSDKYSRLVYYSKKDNTHKAGFIDRNGNIIIPLEYQEISYGIEENGLIAASKNGKWGFINLKNEIIIPFVYDNSFPSFENGKARVEKNGKEFYIDKTGKCVEGCD